MIAGMGWLLDLCPPPEEIVLEELLKPYGTLPSQVAQDDWEYLVSARALRNLQANYQAWNQMVTYDPEAGVGGGPPIDQDLIQYMLELMQEAKDKWTRRSVSS